MAAYDGRLGYDATGDRLVDVGGYESGHNADVFGFVVMDGATDKHRIHRRYSGRGDISDEVLERDYGEGSAAGKLRLVPRNKGISTTDIIRRVLELHA